MMELISYFAFAFLSIQIVAAGMLVREALWSKSEAKDHGYRCNYD